MTGFSPTVRQIVHRRAEDWCERCGTTPGVHIHHRRVKGQGGTTQIAAHQPSNALLVCLRCHHEIHRTPANSRKHGWLVSQADSPGEVPVLYRGTLVWLDDRGNLST